MNNRSTYNNLSVYKSSYDLLLITFEVVKKFDREYKYTFGDKIKNEIIDLITSIYRENSSFDERLVNIKKARGRPLGHTVYKLKFGDCILEFVKI